MFETTFKLSIGQKVFDKGFKALLGAYLLHWVWSYYLIEYLDLGLVGCALSRDISITTSFILLYVQLQNDERFKQTLQIKYKKEYLFTEWISFI